MQLRQSQRQHASMKMALQGPSGSGKSYSALLIAYGICNDWSKIAVIDTENKSADLYAHLGNYNVLAMDSPYATEKYIQAIDICEKEGMQVIIIDSISHAWEYLLDFHANLTGNSFQNWNKVNPRQKDFIDKMLQSPCHIIATMRVKQDYVLNQTKEGKYVPEKVGLKSVMRDGIDYEFTILFEIDIKHNAIASKDRTGLFINRPDFRISIDTGKEISQWCSAAISADSIRSQIQAAKSIEELTRIYNQYPTWYAQLQQDFNLRKQQLQPMQQPINNIVNNLKISSNGTYPRQGNGYHRN